MAALLFDARLWLGRKIHGELSFGVVKVGSRRIVKGPCLESEAEAMEFVRNNTSIPVPRIFQTHRRKSGLYIEMECVQGKDLDVVWRDLTPEQKSQLISNVANYIQELRELPPPAHELVASAEQHELRDGRIGSKPCGPFKTHADFHSLLRGHIPLDQTAESFSQKVVECHSRTYRTVFTHADLAMRNIIVDDGRITAIIDWAFSGWYPEYWEFTKAHYGQLNIPDWYGPLADALTRYDDELQAERALWARLDWPGDHV